MDQTLKMFQELTDARGVAGNEREPREIMKKWITPYADTVEQDGIGSLIAKKVGQEKGPKIMVAGHLDEVGFMVTRIDSKGFISFQAVGGWWSQVMLAQRVSIITRSGETITGIIGSKPPHILTPESRKQAVDQKDLFIDIGATSKEEVIEWGVTPGDQIVPDAPFTVLKNPDLLLAKAWDNRIGCAIAIEVLKQLQSKDHPNTVYGVGTVQEEVGLRGAKTATAQIKPDIAFAVDVSVAGDTPGISEREASGDLGAGPQILLYDASMVAHTGLRDLVVDTAEEYAIPFQYGLMPGGGTDAGSIHVSVNGVPTLVICIATRYIHSHAAIIHRQDFTQAVALLVAVIEKLDAATVQEITFGK